MSKLIIRNIALATFQVPSPRGVMLGTEIFGLGEDSKPYRWNYEKGEWELHSKSEEKVELPEEIGPAGRILIPR